MSNFVFFHAHPDDEASQTAGMMARAAREGHRVVVVYGTNGDHGEAAADLAPGESVVDRRRTEAAGSAQALGTARIGWLGYSDSGMTGWEQNNDPANFHQADLDEAARRLAILLDEEDADALITYDWHGGYGHPDHVKAHQVAHRAADLASRRPVLFESTMSRDQMREFNAAARAAGEELDFDPDQGMDDGNPFGTPQSEIHWQVDVSEFLTQKRAAMQAHSSQTSDIGMMLGLPPEVFAAWFGTEWLIEPGRSGSIEQGWPFDRFGRE
ncbi:PIG-L deacetylase family protein [Calidifontibacter terrae]